MARDRGEHGSRQQRAVPQSPHASYGSASSAQIAEWLGETPLTSPLTTPDDGQFGGLYIAASHKFGSSCSADGDGSDSGDSLPALKTAKTQADAEAEAAAAAAAIIDAQPCPLSSSSSVCSTGPDGSHLEDPADGIGRQGCAVAVAASAAGGGEVVDVDSVEPHLIGVSIGTPPSSAAKAERRQPVVPSALQGALSPPRPFLHHRKPSWTLPDLAPRGTHSVLPAQPSPCAPLHPPPLEPLPPLPPLPSADLSPRSIVAQPIGKPAPSSWAPPRQLSQSSMSSTCLSDWGSNSCHTGAAPRARTSSKTSLTSTLSLRVDSDSDILSDSPFSKGVGVTIELADMPASLAQTINIPMLPQQQQQQQQPSPQSTTTGHTSATASTSSIIRDDGSRRARIILEIISTEETYTKALEELVEIYVSPSSTGVDGAGQAQIPASERRQVFTNIEGILEFHRSALLPALRVAAGPLLATCGLPREHDSEESFRAFTASVAESVANVFERHAVFFRMYSSYVNHVDSAQQRVQAWQADAPTTGMRTRFGGGRLSAGAATMLPWDFRSGSGGGGGGGMSSGSTSESYSASSCRSLATNLGLVLTSKERKRIRTFLQRARVHPRHSQISLEAYLLLPVQRIPRYRLLMEELVRFCPQERLQDAGAIVHALDSIACVATSMNESKRQSEMDRRLLQWQERIRGSFPSPLVQPHRKLVKCGTLMLQRITTRGVPSPRSSSLSSGSGSSSSEQGAVRFRGASFSAMPSAAGTAALSALEQFECFSFGPHLDVQNGLALDTSGESVDRPVEVILCNDITVVVEGTCDGSASGTLAPVDLVAVVRICSDVKIVNQKTLRIIDPVHILYLEATSTAEAHAWKEALESVHQSTVSPPAKAAPVPTRPPLRQVKSYHVLSSARTGMS